MAFDITISVTPVAKERNQYKGRVEITEEKLFTEKKGIITL